MLSCWIWWSCVCMCFLSVDLIWKWRDRFDRDVVGIDEWIWSVNAFVWYWFCLVLHFLNQAKLEWVLGHGIWVWFINYIVFWISFGGFDGLWYSGVGLVVCGVFWRDFVTNRVWICASTLVLVDLVFFFCWLMAARFWKWGVMLLNLWFGTGGSIWSCSCWNWLC